MVLQVETPASTWPVTQAQAKTWLRITTADENDDVDLAIAAAVDAAQRMTSGNVVLAPVTFDLILDSFPDGNDRLYIPTVPLASITSLAYYDGANDSQSLTENTEYTLLAPTDGQAWLKPVVGGTWPSTADRDDAVTIRLIAGYANAAAVPDCVLMAIRLLIGHFWENREAVVTGTISADVKLSVRSLLDAMQWGFVA